MSDDHTSVRLPRGIRIVLDEVSEDRFDSKSEAIRYALNVVFLDDYESLDARDNE